MTSNSKLIMHTNKKSVAAEMYRKLRTNIIYSKGGKLPQVIVVTSSVAGEGKTTTSANLAIAFAQTGRKTLLLDCDMRKPAIHQLFGLSKAVGFSTVIKEPERLSEIILHMEDTELDVIVAGPSLYDPTELLSSPKLNKVFSLLKGIYDVIIVDTPPVGLTTDAALLAHVSDAYIMVVAEGAATVSEFRNAKEHLLRSGADIIGAVFNKMGAVMGKNSYYYKYYYRSSGYGSAYASYGSYGTYGSSSSSSKDKKKKVKVKKKKTRSAAPVNKAGESDE